MWALANRTMRDMRKRFGHRIEAAAAQRHVPVLPLHPEPLRVRRRDGALLLHDFTTEHLVGSAAPSDFEGLQVLGSYGDA